MTWFQTPFFLFPATATATLLLSGAPRSQDVAWAWVDPAGLTGTWTPSGPYQHVTGGGTIQVTRDTTVASRFIVDIPGFPVFGAPHASAYGGNHSVVVRGWVPGTAGVRVVVECYEPNGVPAPDGAFTIHYRHEGPEARREAYLWANLPTVASYTPSATFSWNGDRPDPTIVRTAPGRYVVTLPELAPLSGDYGHVQVAPVGHEPLRAQVENWSVSAADMQVTVTVRDFAGVATDAAFTLHYHEDAAPIDPQQGSGVHLLADRPSLAYYAPRREFTDGNGDVGANGIERIERLGIGRYRVELPSVVPTGSATAQVTAFGTDASHASIEGWSAGSCSGTDVVVRTWASDGSAVDAAFALNYLTDRAVQRREVAWAWVDPASNPAQVFVPDTDYQWTSSGEQITVERDGNWSNRFHVRIPGMTSAYGVPLVSSYGTNTITSVRSWDYSSSTDTLTITVSQDSPNAPFVDGSFTVQWRALGGRDDREAYAFADQAVAASYTPDIGWNGDRGDPIVTRTATGFYQVRFPGLAPVGTEQGHVQASPVATPGSSRRATVTSWAPSGGDMVVNVSVTTYSGVPGDGPFVVSYQEVAAPVDERQGSGAHVYSHALAPASTYSPLPAYTDSNGTTGPANAETITQLGTGVYLVELPDVAPAEPSIASVTAYNGVGHYASIGSWSSNGGGGTQVTVRTYDEAGAPTDGRFTLQFLTARPAAPVAAGELEYYGSGCNATQLDAFTAPILCADWELKLSPGPSNAIVGFVSLDVTSANAPLGIGAPTCSLYTGGAIIQLVPLLPAAANHFVQLPSSPSVLGLDLYAQGGVYRPGINLLNLSFSNGVRGRVGER